MTAATDLLDFNPADPAVRDDPFPVLKRLRDEDPVHWSPRLKAWVISRYEDVRRVAVGDELSPNRLTPFFESLPDPDRDRIKTLMRYLNLWMVFRDPPEHTRLRKLMNRAFTPNAIDRLEPSVTALVEQLIDRHAADGGLDLVKDFAYPLPATVIMDMLGCPRGAIDEIKEWSDGIALFLGSARTAEDKYARAEAGAQAMAAFFRELVEERRRHPRDDMLTALIAARDEEQMLTDDEVIAAAILFLFAGHETTTNLMTNGLYHMLRLGEPWEQLKANPTIAESAVEEALRFDGPSAGLARVVRVSHDLHGRQLTEGERVFAMLHGANRDERRFPDPDRMDLARAPNKHLTFGFGIHFCLGAPLARLEGRIAFAAFARRFPGMRLAREGMSWSDSIIIRGITEVPVELH